MESVKQTTPQPYGEEEKTEVVEQVAEVKKNKLYDEMTDGTYVVHSKKDGDFILEDIPYEKVVAVRKRLTRKQNDGTETIDTDKLTMALISESLIKPKIGELDLVKMRTSTVMKLQGAISDIYDLTSFLS